MTTTKVVLADDHAVVRDGLRVLLERSGDMQVIGVAGNGHEAVRSAERLRPDIIVMDIAMPQLDGIEATRRIRKSCPQIHVLILSMSMDVEHIVRALQAGAMGYVLKESAGEEVAEAIHAIRMGRRYLSPSITETVVQDYLRERLNVSPIDSLSLRERDVLQYVVEGRTSAEIARILSLSRKTVETYRSRVMKKLGVTDTVALVKFAMRSGITR
jgi:DNA-binding NarL/FixJ family response regulator